MRAKEFINEAKGPGIIYKAQRIKGYKEQGVPKDGDPHEVNTRSESDNAYGSTREKLHPEQEAVMNAMIDVPNQSFYDLYRLGISIAAGDGHDGGVDHLGQNAFFLPFAKEEHARTEKQMRRHGLQPKKISTPGSLEPGTVNTQSVVNKPKKNKYGV